MAETIMKFMLEELKTVRLVCQTKDCNTIIELPLAKLRTVPKQCPSCGEEFFDPRSQKDQQNYVGDLLTAVHHMAFVSGRVKVEFVLADTSTPKKWVFRRICG